MVKKIFLTTCFLALLGLPMIVLAQETAAAVAQDKTLFHLIYEKSVGPIGAVAGFIGIIAMWQLAYRVSPAFGFFIRIFAVIILLLNVGSISFGLHGVGIVGKEMTRYIERLTRFSALVLFDIGALMLYFKLEKNNKNSQENKAAPAQN